MSRASARRSPLDRGSSTTNKMVLRSEHAHQSWIHRRFATVSPAVRAAIIHSTLARKPMESIACILKRRT